MQEHEHVIRSLLRLQHPQRNSHLQGYRRKVACTRKEKCFKGRGKSLTLSSLAPLLCNFHLVFPQQITLTWQSSFFASIKHSREPRCLGSFLVLNGLECNCIVFSSFVSFFNQNPQQMLLTF